MPTLYLTCPNCNSLALSRVADRRAVHCHQCLTTLPLDNAADAALRAAEADFLDFNRDRLKHGEPSAFFN